MIGVILDEPWCLVSSGMNWGGRHIHKNEKTGVNVGIANFLSLWSLKPIQREFKPQDQGESVIACGIGIRMDNVLHVWLNGESR